MFGKNRDYLDHFVLFMFRESGVIRRPPRRLPGGWYLWRVVADVALIAIARKVVILDVKEYKPLQVVGIAFIIAALAGTHWVIKRARPRSPERSTEH